MLSGGVAVALLILLLLAGVAGVGLTAIGLRGRRVGDHPHCRQCGHDLFGTPGDICGECGADVSRPGAVVTGVRERRGRLLAGGLALLLVGGLPLALVALTWARAVDRHAWTPTFALLWELPGDGRARDELLRRWRDDRLGESAGRALAGEAMAVHAAATWDAAWWPTIEEAVRRDALTEDQRAALFDQAVTWELAVRPTVQRGREPDMVVKPVPGRLGGNTTLVARYVWTGLDVDGEPAPAERFADDRLDGDFNLNPNGWGGSYSHAPTPPADGDTERYDAHLRARLTLAVPGGVPIERLDVPLELSKTIPVTDGLAGDYGDTPEARDTLGRLRLTPVRHDDRMTVRLDLAGPRPGLGDFPYGWRLAVHVGGETYTHDESGGHGVSGGPADADARIHARFPVAPTWPRDAPQPDYPAVATIVLRTDVADVEEDDEIKPIWCGELRWENVTLDPATAIDNADIPWDDPPAGLPPTAVEPLTPAEAERRNEQNAAAAER